MTRPRRPIARYLPAGVLALACAVCVPAAGLAQTASAQRDAVARELARERDLRGIEVSLDDEQRVLLTGNLPTLWVKMQAIERALEVSGGREVVSELTLPRAESDEDLAEDVTKAIQNYEYYTVFDYITGRIDNGVVTLDGKVTSIPEKSSDLTERVAKVRGVQDLQNRIETMTPSRSDDNLRFRVAQVIFRHPSFERFAGMINPPFHIIVDNSIVTLIGYVQTQIEMIEIQQLVSQVQGILRVENRLQTVR